MRPQNLSAVRQNPTCKICTVFQPILPYNTAKTSTGQSCVTPKPVCGGPCGRPSAWMPPTVSQDATQSVWGPTLGSPGHPQSGKIKNMLNFTHSRVPKKDARQKTPNLPKSQKNLNFSHFVPRKKHNKKVEKPQTPPKCRKIEIPQK